MKAENRGIEDKLFHTLCTRWEKQPFAQSQGIILNYLGQGVVGMGMIAKAEYVTVEDRLHGGMIAALADHAMGWSVITLGRASVTVDMYVNYFRPVSSETGIIAEGKVIYAGNRTVVAEASVINEQGQTMAKSRGTYLLKKVIK